MEKNKEPREARRKFLGKNKEPRKKLVRWKKIKNREKSWLFWTKIKNRVKKKLVSHRIGGVTIHITPVHDHSLLCREARWCCAVFF